MRRPQPLAVVVAAAAILLVTAVLTTARWHRAENDPGLATAHARDLVLARAQDAAIQLSTLDYRRPTASSAAWKRVTTGKLYTSLVDGKNDYQQLVTAGKVITTAQTTGAAVQSLAKGNAHAVVLVGLDVTVTPADGQASVEHERLVLTMTHTGSGWKASAMEPVASG
jgi:Mce-associated membrane protein